MVMRANGCRAAALRCNPLNPQPICTSRRSIAGAAVYLANMSAEDCFRRLIDALEGGGSIATALDGLRSCAQQDWSALEIAPDAAAALTRALHAEGGRDVRICSSDTRMRLPRVIPDARMLQELMAFMRLEHRLLEHGHEQALVLAGCGFAAVLHVYFASANHISGACFATAAAASPRSVLSHT